MPDKIANQGRSSLDITQTRARSIGSSQRREPTGGAPAADTPRDGVELTSTAMNLKRIEARLADVSETDQGRVDEVRQRLDAGSYEIDHDRIAQKLMRLEQDLA